MNVKAVRLHLIGFSALVVTAFLSLTMHLCDLTIRDAPKMFAYLSLVWIVADAVLGIMLAIIFVKIIGVVKKNIEL